MFGSHALSRRAVLVQGLAGGLILPLAPGLAMAAPRNLTFAVFRNNARIGEHHIAFVGDGDSFSATTEADMTVKLGPVPVFKYRHHAVETLRGGAFASLETSSTSNGKQEHVTAEKTAAGVSVDCPSGKAMLPASAGPLNHWNARNFAGPLFNPETGKLMKVAVAKAGAGHWTLRGEVEMDDFYDDAGNWSGAKAKGTDGSTIEYRRI
jgi:hypothetical protein